MPNDTPPAGALQFEGSLTERDFTNAARLSAKVTLKQVFLLCGVIGVLAGLGAYPSHGGKGLLFGLPALLLPVLVVWMTQVIARRQWKSSPLSQSLLRGWASDEAVHFQHGLAEATINWRAFAGYQATADLVMLFQNSQSYNLFSRNLFANDDDWQRFRGLVESKIGRPRPQPMGKVPVALTVVILALVFLLLLLALAF